METDLVKELLLKGGFNEAAVTEKFSSVNEVTREEEALLTLLVGLLYWTYMGG